MGFGIRKWISILLVTGLITGTSSIFLSSSSASASNETDTVSITDSGRPDIVISYTRQETPREDVAANISVITRKELEQMPVTSVGEALQYMPGVYVEFNGGPGASSFASIQGSDARHVAVFQDGVPLTLLANPVADLSHISLGSVERIEVYKGAASSAWGSSLGGAINIVTREPDLTKPLTGVIRSSYGDFNTLREYGSATGTIDRFGYLVSSSHEQSDGFVAHTSYRQDAVYGKFNYYINPTSRVNFVCNYDEGRNDNPVVTRPYWQDAYQKRIYERLLYENSFSPDVSCTIEARHQDYDYNTKNIYNSGKLTSSLYSETSNGMSARLLVDKGSLNRFTAGFDGDWGDYDFSGYSDRYASRTLAFYANDTLSFSRFTFNAGARVDNDINFGTEFSPSGGMVYHLPWNGSLVRAQVSHGFSAPPGAWVNDPVYGNKDLKPETGMNYQLGAEINPFKFLKLEVNLFRADLGNLIQYSYTTTRFENLGAVTRQGVEATVRAAFDNGFSCSFGGSSIEVRNSDTGEIVKDVPRTLLDTTISYTYKGWLSNSLVGRYIDNNSSYAETCDKVFIFDYLLKVTLPGMPIFCSGHCGTPKVFFAVHNLTDANYLYRLPYPQAGRWVEGGVSFEF